MSDIPASQCPTCSADLNAATSLDDPTAVPSAGDVTVCLYCGEVLEFEDGLTLKKIEINTLVDADFVDLSRIQRVVREYKRQREQENG